MTEAQILDEHPDLEKDDFPALYQLLLKPAVGPRSGEPAAGRKPLSTPASTYLIF
jgi:hypothetical protein